jgi:hypothetical protein
LRRDQEGKEGEYFAAVQAGMDRDYGLMEKIFGKVIAGALPTRR